MPMLVSSPSITGFTLSGRLAASTLCNEADTGLLSLRLTRSPLRASEFGLLLTPPDWLPVEREIDRATSFHVARSARLGLAHQIPQISQISQMGSGHEGEAISLLTRKGQLVFRAAAISRFGCGIAAALKTRTTKVARPRPSRGGPCSMPGGIIGPPPLAFFNLWKSVQSVDPWPFLRI